MMVQKKITREQKVILAKNANDRVNRPSIIFKQKAKKYKTDNNPELKLLNVTIKQAAETYATVMVKPLDGYGCYSGINAHGVAVGNVEVMSKNKGTQDAILGIEICRLIIERCKTALDGVELVKELLSTYCVGGGGSLSSPTLCDSSFLIADSEGGYLVETCGQKMVARKADDIEALANEYIIEENYEISNLDKKINFKKTFYKGLFAGQKSSQVRRFKMYADIVDARDGKRGKTVFGFSFGKMSENQPAEGIYPSTFLSILRSHDEISKERQDSVCVHRGNKLDVVTTRGFIAVPESGLFYVTLGSVPCRSLFVPFSVKGELPFFEDEKKGELFWYKHEIIMHNISFGQIDLTEFLADRDSLESAILNKAVQLSVAKKADCTRLNAEIFETAENFIDRWFLKSRLDLKGFSDKEAGPLKKLQADKQTKELFSNYNRLLKEENS